MTDIKTTQTEPATLQKFVVSYTRIPTNFHSPESVVVEAAKNVDALLLVKDSIRDLAPMSNYVYDVRPYAAPPAGKILGRLV